MNARADALTAMLRAMLGTLPGATSVSIHALKAWTLILITTSSDEAVNTLNEELGLGGDEVRIARGRWWRRATSERDEGALRIEVTGPHHIGSPPGDDAAGGST
jgi:hypothetical protein